MPQDCRQAATLCRYALWHLKAVAGFIFEQQVRSMETPAWALVPPANFQAAEQKRFDSVVSEAVHKLTMSLLNPNVANLQTQMSHTTSTSFRTSVQIHERLTGLNKEDFEKSAASEMRESLRQRLRRNVRIFVDFWTEKRKIKGKGKDAVTVQMVSARVVWW